MRAHLYLALALALPACDAQSSNAHDDLDDASEAEGINGDDKDAGGRPSRADGGRAEDDAASDAAWPRDPTVVVTSEDGPASDAARPRDPSVITTPAPDATSTLDPSQVLPEAGLVQNDAQVAQPDPAQPPSSDVVRMIGAGGGGAISGEIIAYNPNSAEVEGVGNVFLYACYLMADNQCDPSRSPSGLIGGGLRAGYSVDGLDDGAYLLMAYKDRNGNGALNDVGDWSAVYSLDGRIPTVLRPPIQNVNVRMKPSELDSATLPAPQYAAILGTWGTRPDDTFSATMHLYGDGSYDYVSSISNNNPLCSVAGASFQQGTANLTGSILVLTPSDSSGGVGGTCAVGSFGPGNPYHFVELTIDEIGRPALILRWPSDDNVIEDVFIPK